MATASLSPDLQKIELPAHKRTAPIASKSPVVNQDDRTFSFSFSSTAPVERFDWEEWESFDEILSHDPAHVRLDRVTQKSCPLLAEHRSSLKLGRILSVSLEGDRGIATAKISRGASGDQLLSDLEDDIATSASFMYRVYAYQESSPAEYTQTEYGRVKTKNAVMTAIDWEIFEISMVAIPADPSVGASKSDASVEGDRNSVSVRSLTPSPTMTTPKTEDSSKEVESLRSLNTNLERDLASAQSQLKTAQDELQEVRSGIESRDATIAQLQKRDAVVSKYNTQRRKADTLLSEARISAVEFEDLFGEVDADVDRLLKSESSDSELSNIAFYLEKATRRAPLLNITIKTAKEPLEQDGSTQTADEIEKQARSMMAGISPTTRVAV